MHLQKITNLLNQGTFMFKIELNGIYSTLNKFYPNWNIQCSIDNGSLKYPQKQLKIQDVALEIKSGNSDISGKDAYLNINSFKMNLNNQLLNGSLQLTDIFKIPQWQVQSKAFSIFQI